MREIPLSTLRSMYALSAEEYPIVLIDIERVGMEDIIRLSSDPTVRITEDPIAYGTISNGETYAFFPFDITLPADEGDTVPKMRLVVPNVSAEIGWWLRSSLQVPMVTVTLISNIDLDTPIAIFPDFELRSFSAGTMSVEGQMILSGLDREPFPAGAFSPSFFPGLF